MATPLLRELPIFHQTWPSNFFCVLLQLHLDLNSHSFARRRVPAWRNKIPLAWDGRGMRKGSGYDKRKHFNTQQQGCLGGRARGHKYVYLFQARMLIFCIMFQALSQFIQLLSKPSCWGDKPFCFMMFLTLLL